MHAVGRAILGLAAGLIRVPPGVDPGDFIVAGGTPREARKARVRAWDCLYLDPGDLAGLLQAVREPSDTDFSCLLSAILADTGMRRGEVLPPGIGPLPAIRAGEQGLRPNRFRLDQLFSLISPEDNLRASAGFPVGLWLLTEEMADLT